MGKSSPPAAPNPSTVSSAQTSSNIGTATANAYLGNVNTYSPQGSTTYAPSGTHTVTTFDADGKASYYDVPSFSQTNTLSPAEQTKLDQQNQLGISLNNVAQQQTDKIGAQLNTPVNANSIGPQMVNSIGLGPAMGNAASFTPNAGNVQSSIGPQGQIQSNYGSTDYSADRAKVEDALYSRVNPQLDRDRNALETKLVNQGLVRGTTAFNNAMDESNRQANDARMQVITAGGAEQSRLAGLAQQAGTFANSAQQQGYDQSLGAGTFANAAQQQLYGQQQGTATFNNQATAQNNDSLQRVFTNSQASGDFQNTARQQALQEMLALRNQPINEISGLMSGGQVNIPQFQSYNAPNIANTDVSGNYYNSAALNNQNYQTQASQQNALVGGLAGLGGAGLYGLLKK